MNNSIEQLIKYTLNEDINPVDQQIIDILKMYADHSSGLQQKIYQEKLNMAQSVQVSSIYDVFDEDTIERIKTRIAPQKKGCYQNAYKLCDRINDPRYEIKYCEGFLNYKGLPIDHAWNSVNGVYIDITSELALESDLTDTYVLLAEFDKQTMWELALQTGTYDGLLNQQLINKYKNNNN